MTTTIRKNPYAFLKYLLEPQLQSESDLILFNTYFDITLLPFKVCSSKYMFKRFNPSTKDEVSALRKTFSNYFKKKVGSIH
jgi:hypothetical protein